MHTQQRLLAYLTLIIGSFCGWVSASHAADDLDFHIKDSAFVPIEPAQWMLDAPLAAYAGPSQVDSAVDAGVDVFHGSGGWPYYPLRSVDPDSGFYPDEIQGIEAMVAAVHGRGRRFTSGIAPYAPPALVRLHPDWLIHYSDSTSIDQQAVNISDGRFDNLGLRNMCLISSPWRDYQIDMLAEIMQQYGMDGFSFDGNYEPYICYCTYCKAKYLNDTGNQIPFYNMNSTDYRLYLVWKGDQLESWYSALHARLRQIRPDAAIPTWTVNAGRYGHFIYNPPAMSRRSNLLFDVPMQEWWLDESNLGGSIVPAFGASYVRAVTADRGGACEPYLMSRADPYGTYSFPVHEAVARSLLAVASGAHLAISYGWTNIGQSAGAAVSAAIAPRKPWLTNTRTEPWVGQVFSEQTRMFNGPIQDNTLDFAFGAFRAARENHQATQLLTEWDITPQRLAQFKAIVLPNVACLTEEQVQTIKNYVAAGGGLVATYETSSYDAVGRPVLPAATPTPVPTPTPDPANLVQNSGFEAGNGTIPDNWDLINTTRTTQTPKTGQWAAHFVEPQDGVMTQIINVEQNTDYTVKANFLRGTALTSKTYGIFIPMVQTGGYAFAQEWTFNNGSPTWINRSGTFNTGSNTQVKIELVFRGGTGAQPYGEMFVDDISFKKVGTRPAVAQGKGETIKSGASAFALSDVFGGIQIISAQDGVAFLDWRPGQATDTTLTAGDEQIEEQMPNHTVVFRGKWLGVTEPTSANMRVAARISTTEGSGGSPAILVGTYGQGRVVYMAAGLDSAYYKYWFPYQGRLLRNAVNWAAQTPYPVSIKAPMCVQSTFFRQNNAEGERLVVHLYNGVNSAGDHGNQAIEVPLRTEVVPIAGVEVEFDASLDLGYIHLEPGNITPNVITLPSGARRVEIPPLELHTMVVAEFAHESRSTGWEMLDVK